MKQKIISCITGLIFTINIQAQTERGYEISHPWRVSHSTTCESKKTNNK